MQGAVANCPQPELLKDVPYIYISKSLSSHPREVINHSKKANFRLAGLKFTFVFLSLVKKIRKAENRIPCKLCE